MTAWEGNRHNAEWTFARVEWPTFREIGTYGCFTGGSISFASGSSIKATCELEWSGEQPDPNDLVKIRYTFRGDDGERYSVDVGTFVISYDGDSAKDGNGKLKTSGTITGRSLLAILDDMKAGFPYHVYKGENAVGLACSICEDLELPFVADESSYKVGNAHTFDPGTSYLAIVNWLLDAAGFMSADVGSSGGIEMRRSVDPTDREADWEFSAGSESILGLEINRTNDYLSSPNTVWLAYQDNDCCLTAVARAWSGCRSALKERGNREVTQFEEVSDLEGDPTTEAGRKAMGNALAEKAHQMLLLACREIDKCEWTHPLVPIRLGSCARINAYGYDAKFNVTNIDIAITPAATCTTSGRRFIGADVDATWLYEWEWY